MTFLNFKKVILALKCLLSIACISTLVACNSTAKESGQDDVSASQKNVHGRPNFVWLVSEDNSQHYLNHFFDGGAQTPAIEKLATEGITFTRAYSNAPVCSVARTTLQTGVYAPKLGVQYHRAYKPMPMPDDVQYVHQWLKRAGYYVTNNSKTDYNFSSNDKKTWHHSSKKASWRLREDQSQPFFHMQTLFVSHESRLHFDESTFNEQRNNFDLQAANLPPYMPDTDLFRFTQLYYQSLIQQADSQVAEVIQQLEDDGELENTFVFYFSDHGGVLPRGKGYIYESGIHVPLVVRVPKHYRHLLGDDFPAQVNEVVEFVDFAPTLLALAGLDKPDVMDGKALLGAKQAITSGSTHEFSYSYADRFDEKYDLVRSITLGNYQYIRSFQPYLPDGLHNRYRYKMLAYQQWRDLYDEGKLNHYQSRFFEAKPKEMLFDVSQDPHELNNLASLPEHQETLSKLREKLINTMANLPDLGLLPESYLYEENIDDPLAFGIRHKAQLAALLDIANMQLSDFSSTKSKITKVLEQGNDLQRYWAVMVLLSYTNLDNDTLESVSRYLHSGPHYLQIKIIELLGLHDRHNPQPLLTAIINQSQNPVAVTEALNAVVYFDENSPYSALRSQLKPSVEGRGISARMAFLTKARFVKH